MRPFGPACSASTNSPSFAPFVAPAATIHSFCDPLSTGRIRPPSEPARNTPRTRSGLVPIRRMRRAVWLKSSPFTSVRRPRIRFPAPSAGSDDLRVSKMRGSGPAPSHSMGRANRSPLVSGARTSNTVTGGRLSGSRYDDLRFCSFPSASSSRRMRFRSMRAAPLIPNARAMSRLAVWVGFSDIHSRTSDLEGIRVIVTAYHGKQRRSDPHSSLGLKYMGFKI